MEIITSKDNKKIKNLSKLLQKKYRELENKFLVEGEHLVSEAYKTNNLLEIIKCEDCNIEFDVPTTYVTYEVLKKLSNTETPQKIIGVCKRTLSNEIKGNILIIDNLQDPGNLGTIIRSSAAFNIDTIIVSENTVDLYNDKVLRSGEGMIFHTNIVKKELISTIEDLKKDNYTILGTKVDGGINLNEIEIPSKYAFIIGNEGAGVREEILNMCDKYLYIPMNKNCESLNAGVATSIILYEFSIRR